MKKHLPAFALIAVWICGMVACSSLGLAPTKSFDEQLANAYGVHTAVVNATATAVTAGVINSTEAIIVQSQAKNARAMLDAAKMAEQLNNITAANNDLTLALNALTALQTYLNQGH